MSLRNPWGRKFVFEKKLRKELCLFFRCDVVECNLTKVLWKVSMNQWFWNDFSIKTTSMETCFWKNMILRTVKDNVFSFNTACFTSQWNNGNVFRFQCTSQWNYGMSMFSPRWVNENPFPFSMFNVFLFEDNLRSALHRVLCHCKFQLGFFNVCPQEKLVTFSQQTC